jgi:hypothetical protein
MYAWQPHHRPTTMVIHRRRVWQWEPAPAGLVEQLVSDGVITAPRDQHAPCDHHCAVVSSRHRHLCRQRLPHPPHWVEHCAVLAINTVSFLGPPQQGTRSVARSTPQKTAPEPRAITPTTCWWRGRTSPGGPDHIRIYPLTFFLFAKGHPGRKHTRFA